VIRVAVGALLIAIVSGCTATPSVPSASPATIASPSATPTASPAPTTAAPSPTATRHVNPVLGYGVTLPPGWRISECLSGLIREGSFIGYDVLTTRTPTEEHDLGAGGDTGGSGALTWIISIGVETSTRSPAEYATAAGGSIGERLETLTIDGKPAVRRVDGVGRASTYYVANAGRMYLVGLSQGFDARPPLVTDAAFDAVAQSISFVTAIARPTPTPVPTLSPAVEALVDAVTAAFAASDADRLRELMPPKCWFHSAGYQSSGVSVSREKMAEGFRASFAKGLKVTVEARPIMTDAPFLKGPFWVWSDWSAYGSAPFTPRSTTQLVFDQIDGRWYWIGALFNAGSLRR
jgi:hypothetical protein